MRRILLLCLLLLPAAVVGQVDDSGNGTNDTDTPDVADDGVPVHVLLSIAAVVALVAVFVYVARRT